MAEPIRFAQPADPKVKLWRYMDFTKFVSLLDNCALYFSRADRLGDPFEGSMPLRNIEVERAAYERWIASTASWPEATRAALPAAPWNEMSMMRMAIRGCCYVSCWHMNETESFAMWKQYTRSNESIAIQTTYDNLREALPGDGQRKPYVHLGVVSYIDYERGMIPARNDLLDQLFHKRLSFEHEREARALIFEPERIPPGAPGLQPNPQLGMAVPVDLCMLVHHVYVAPTAPAWLTDLTQRLVRRYGLDIPVSQSRLDADPLF